MPPCLMFLYLIVDTIVHLALGTQIISGTQTLALLHPKINSTRKIYPFQISEVMHDLTYSQQRKEKLTKRVVSVAL